jgi:hypothetical protein
MRLACALLALLLMLAACGDDDGPSPTITAEPTNTEPAVAPGQLTPNPDACTADVLDGSVKSVSNQEKATVITLDVVNTDRRCEFDGAPELRFYTAAGSGLGVAFLSGPDCSSDATDYGGCVYQDAIELPEAGSGTPSGVRAVMTVSHLSALPACPSPGAPVIEATTIGLVFPGVARDLLIPLTQPLELQTCIGQVELTGYGPLAPGD